jgi:trigger factor
MHTLFYEALIKEGLKLAGTPHLEHDHEHHPRKGESFTFSAEFDIFPDIKLNDFNALKLEKKLAKFTDMDLEKTITTIRKLFNGKLLHVPHK